MSGSLSASESNSVLISVSMSSTPNRNESTATKNVQTGRRHEKSVQNLPQTGNTNNTSSTLLGGMLGVLAAALGFRRKKNERN